MPTVRFVCWPRESVSPAIVGLAGFVQEVVTGDRLLIWNLDVMVNPDLDTVIAYEKARSEADAQLSLNLPYSTYF